MSSYTDRDIHREIAGRELEILQAVGIHPQGRGHQHCSFPDHEDRNPSWRWDASKARWFCSCGSGTVIDAVMRTEGLAAGEAIRWIRSTVLGDDEAPRPRRRPPPANGNAEQQHRHRLQEEVASRALKFWREADQASPNHPYLRAKGVGPHELRERNGVLYVPLFDIDGRIWTLQTISQDADGGFVKRFMRGGRAAGLFAPIGLNAPPRRVIVCEGVATAATLHEQTGWPVMAAMNAQNLTAVAKTARQAWPEADLILAADNDRRTRGNPGVTKATEAALAMGARLAVPEFPQNAGDKDTDFNDLQRLAPGAVAAAIEAAKMPAPAPPPPEPARRAFLSAEAASQALTAAVDEFFDMALRPRALDVPGAIDLNDYAPFHAIKASVGVGKSRAVLQRLADPALADKHIVYATSTVELAQELKARYDATAKPGSPRMLVILGREQVRPDGVQMCAKRRAAEAVAKLGVSVQTTLCKRQLKGKEAERHGSTVELCPHFHECPYQRQIEDREPAIRVMPHARLFLPGRKDEERSPDIVTIDEAFYGAGLRGTVKLRDDDTQAGREDRGGYFVVLDRLAGEGRGIMSVPRRDGAGEDHDATDHLDRIGARCARALYAGGRLSDFAAQGVGEEDAAAAMNFAYRCIDPLHVTPAMPETVQAERIRLYQGQEALRAGRLFKLIKQALAAGIDPRCFDVVKNCLHDGRLDDRCYMHWSEDLKVGDAAVLLIDADLDEEVARRFVPRLAKVTEIEAEPRNYHATQVSDRRVSMDMLCVSLRVRAAIAETGRIPAELDAKDRTRINNCKRLHRLAEVKAAGGRRGLVVSYKAVAEILRVLPPIEGVEFAHFSALRGVDRWKNVDFVIVVGSPQVNEGDLERTAEALWFLSPEPIKRIAPDGRGKRAYVKEPRRIEMVDGSSTIVSVDTHPDDRCARLLNLIRREVDQGFGRGRLIHRQPDRPCEVLLLTNTPTGLPIHQTTTWREATDVNPIDLLMARGIVPEGWRDAETLLADVVESERGHPGEAMRQAFERAGLPSLAEIIEARVSYAPLYEANYKHAYETRLFRYRLKDRRQGSRILVDLNRHPDPKAAVERILGELTLFEAAASTAAGEAIDAAAPPALVVVPDRAPPDVVAAGEIADTGKISDAVAAEPSQPGPEIVPEPEPALASAAEVGPFSEADDWPGPDPAEMRPQAALPRLVISNPPSESQEGPEKLSDTELIRLLPPKQPTDTAVGWECRCQDVLRVWKIEWFRAQKLVREESTAHNWQAHSPVLLVSTRDSP
jgi:putative DNA primase/helicase